MEQDFFGVTKRRRRGILCMLALSVMAADASASLPDGAYWGAGAYWEPHLGWNHGYYDPWRWQVSIGTGLPYWYRSYAWRASWRYPYRYQQRQHPQSKPIASPQRVTTRVQHSDAIHSLPANARVKQVQGRTVYEWQGVEYVYDWNSGSYKVLK